MRRKINPYVSVKESAIHSMGVSAKKDIPAGTRVIEYIGERITKAESERRAIIPLQRHKSNNVHGAVYIFQLNKRYDIDGDVPYNKAKYINHSCDPNCEVEIIRGHIWIIALRDIKKEQELTYNYGYSYEEYHEHRCNCGAPQCPGYILAEEHWPKLKRVFSHVKTQKRS